MNSWSNHEPKWQFELRITHFAIFGINWLSITFLSINYICNIGLQQHDLNREHLFTMHSRMKLTNFIVVSNYTLTLGYISLKIVPDAVNIFILKLPDVDDPPSSEQFISTEFSCSPTAVKDSCLIILEQVNFDLILFETDGQPIGEHSDLPLTRIFNGATLRL